MDDALVKIISRLRVEYEQPLKAMEALRVKTDQLNASIGNLHITAAQLNQGFSATTAGTILKTGVLYDQYGRILVDVSKRSEEVAKQTKTATDVTKEHAKTVMDTAQAYSVLGSQWERRISWFIAGAAFYGGIRAMRSMIDTFKQMEMDMVVIARTTADLTFRTSYMRDELIKLGKEFGHTWETVADIAIRWTQAGYNMADSIEMTKNSLLALNVAEMDAQMASQGLIAIMSQWELQASDVELVIDKLNITSDRFAVTTGDLVEGLVRASGAARAVNMTFDDTVGVITAMRVATGRAGREVGNAAATILSYITRQTTLNKLMEAGIEVFADAAQTKLRPAMDILTDFANQWSENVSDVPEQLVQIAEEAGLLTEEMAGLVDMQAEWNDLQKIDLETSAAGIRRRNFLIALLRNFAMVTDVVTNMQNAEGHSMMQNIMTMETLEKRSEALRVSFEEMAVAIGEAGLSGGLKVLVDMLRQLAEMFAAAPEGVQTYVVSLGAMTLTFTLLSSLLRMAGVDVASLSAFFVKGIPAIVSYSIATKSLTVATTALGFALKSLVGFLLSPKVLILGLSAGLLAAYVATKRANEEFERQIHLAKLMTDEYDRLDRQLELSIDGSVTHNAALEAKRELTDSIVEAFPELIDGYDRENNMLRVNTEALREMASEYDRLNEARKDAVSEAERQLEIAEANVKAIEDERAELENDIRRITDMAKKREILARAIADEATEADKLEQYRKDEAEARRIITALIGEEATERVKAANWSMDAIDAEIAKLKERGEILRLEHRDEIKNDIVKTRNMITQTQNRIEAMIIETQAINVRNEALKKVTGLEYGMERMVQAEIARYTKAIKENAEAEIKAQAEVDALTAKLERLGAQLDATVPSLSEYDDGTRRAEKGTKTLSDITREFIDMVMRASEVQELANNEAQRTIDLTRTRAEYLKRDTAAHGEWTEGLKEEAKLLPLLRQQQQNINRQIEILRAAKESLIRRQNTLNISTREGFEAYKLLETQIENVSASINGLSIEWYSLQEQQELGISNLERVRSVRQDNISIMQTTIDYYTREAASIEDLARAESVRVVLLEQLQVLEEQYINQIAEQERRIASATELLHRGLITQEQWNKVVADATAAINELTADLYRNKMAMEETGAATIQTAKAFESMVKDLDFYSKLGVFTVSQLIEYTRMAFDKIRGSMTLEQERDEIIRLASLYKEMFGEMQRTAEEAYRERLNALQRSVDEEIAFHQRQLDALDEEQQLEDREETRRQHEQKMEDLLAERRYHELRTGIEHERAIVDIDRQIAEEQRRWDLRQSEWTREDKRDDLNRQIEDIRESAEEQRAEWEKAYQKMQADFDDHFISLLALASAYDENFFEDARRKAEMWVEGFKTGFPEDLFDGFMSDIVPAPPQFGGPSIPGETPEPGTPESPMRRIIDIHDFDLVNGRAYMPARELGDALNEYVSWDDKTGKVTIGGHAFSPFVGEQKYADALEAGTAWLGIRDVGTKLGYSVDFLGSLVRLMKDAHTGAKVLTPGVANLMPGELIFPSNLSSQMEKLIAVLSVKPLPQPSVDRGVNFNAPFYNVEKQIISDDVDAEIVTRELKRQVDMII